jgi:hypothetical protein
MEQTQTRPRRVLHSGYGPMTTNAYDRSSSSAAISSRTRKRKLEMPGQRGRGIWDHIRHISKSAPGRITPPNMRSAVTNREALTRRCRVLRSSRTRDPMDNGLRPKAAECGKLMSRVPFKIINVPVRRLDDQRKTSSSSMNQKVVPLPGSSRPNGSPAPPRPPVSVTSSI